MVDEIEDLYRKLLIADDDDEEEVFIAKSWVDEIHGLPLGVMGEKIQISIGESLGRQGDFQGFWVMVESRSTFFSRNEIGTWLFVLFFYFHPCRWLCGGDKRHTFLPAVVGLQGKGSLGQLAKSTPSVVADGDEISLNNDNISRDLQGDNFCRDLVMVENSSPVMVKNKSVLMDSKLVNKNIPPLGMDTGRSRFSKKENRNGIVRS
ncbi:hypothetical protein PTKIN_Ptkin02bG0118100 [Pterospermum kingtungense]